HGREESQPRRLRGRQRHGDKRVPAQKLAIKNPCTVKASGFDILDERHELRHRGCTRNAERDTYGLGHVGLLCGLGFSSARALLASGMAPPPYRTVLSTLICLSSLTIISG